MKIKYLMVAMPVFLSYGTLTYAATKSFDHEDSKSFFEQSEGHGNKSSHHGNQYEFKDEFNASFENDSDDDNVFLHLSKNEKHHHHGSGHHEGHGHHGKDGHDDNNGHQDDDGVTSGGGNNAVPLPAAFWLFAPSILGLLKFKRKSA